MWRLSARVLTRRRPITKAFLCLFKGRDARRVGDATEYGTGLYLGMGAALRGDSGAIRRLLRFWVSWMHAKACAASLRRQSPTACSRQRPVCSATSALSIACDDGAPCPSWGQIKRCAPA